MKKKFSIMLFLMCVCPWLHIKAVSVTYSDGVATLNFDEDPGVSLWDSNGNPNNWDLINRINSDFTKMVVLGSNVSATDISRIMNLNKFDQNKANQTLDLSDAKGFTVAELSDVSLKASKIILPKGTELPATSVYENSGSKWNSGNLRYVCVLGDDGTVSVGGGNFNNRNGENAIKNDVDANVYPFSEASKIELAGNYTSADEEAVKTFNANNVQTTYKDGVLTLASGDDTAETLPAKVQELGAFEATKVIFPDGSVWERATEKLTATGDAEAHKAALEAAGFTVSSTTTVQSLGKYVTIVDGVTIITIPDGETGVVTSNLGSNQNKLNDAEKAAIKAATNLKLVGPFSDDDWLGLCSGAENVKALDLTDAKISDADENGNGGVKLQNQWVNVADLKLPTDPDYKYLPASFASNTKIETINIPPNIVTIGNGAFQYCSQLTTAVFEEECHVKVIGESAFEGSTLQGPLVIPNSVETIAEKAFKNCWRITSLTINKGSNLYKDGIKANAFFMDGGKDGNELKNVYVFEDEHIIPCDAMAFDYDNQDGQTTMATVKTRLHYPPNLYYYYVGEWKSQINGGKVEGHEDLLALRNVVDNGSANVEGEDVTATPQKGIGWQKFVSSGIPVTADQAWRSYSDVVHIKVPDPDAKVADVYIVTGYQEGKAVLKQMVKGDIIPAGTGVIIHHYVTDTQNGGVLVFPHVTNEEAAGMSADDLKPYRYVIEGDQRIPYQEDHAKYTGISTRDYTPTGESQSYHNYLEALHCMGVYRVIYNAENNNIIDFDNLEMEPFEGQKPTYRNFFFGNGVMIEASAEEERYVGVDWDPNVEGKMGWGFFRCISQLYAVNSKAFLHYPADVFTKARGGSIDATVNNEVITGAKPMGLLIQTSDGEFVDVTDGIATVPSATEDTPAGYYTLTGIKVPAPLKRGIYIHNGKKIVIR